MVALEQRTERRGDAEGQHHDTDHLHEGRDAVEPVVGVEGRGEPGEVDPRPADREHREREPAETDREVILRDRMGELIGCLSEGDHERKVEEQFERRG